MSSPSSRKLFRCNLCMNAYTQARGLSRHRRLEHGQETRLYCRRCPYSANRRDNLKRHYQYQHRPEDRSDLDTIREEPVRERSSSWGSVRRVSTAGSSDTRRMTSRDDEQRSLETSESRGDLVASLPARTAAAAVDTQAKPPEVHTGSQQAVGDPAS